MKKTIFLGLLILVLIFSVACTQKNTAVGTNSEQSMQELKTPEREADLRGRVTDIIGNEVTIIKIAGMSQEEREKMQNLSQEERRALMQESMNTEQKTETFIIPVGTPIATMQLSNEEMILQQEELSVIEKDTTLQIWMTEEGDIELITVMAGRGAGDRGPNQNGRPNPDGGGPPF